MASLLLRGALGNAVHASIAPCIACPDCDQLSRAIALLLRPMPGAI